MTWGNKRIKGDEEGVTWAKRGGAVGRRKSFMWMQGGGQGENRELRPGCNTLKSGKDDRGGEC